MMRRRHVTLRERLNLVLAVFLVTWLTLLEWLPQWRLLWDTHWKLVRLTVRTEAIERESAKPNADATRTVWEFGS